MGKYDSLLDAHTDKQSHIAIANELAELVRLKRIEISMMEIVGVDESNHKKAVEKLRKDLEDQA